MAGMSYSNDQPPTTAAALPLAVVSPQFCASYPIDLTIIRKVLSLSDGSFEVVDVNGNLLFKIKEKLFSLHDQHILIDAAGHPLVTFQQKVMSVHGRWKVFRGESTEERDLIFTVKRSSLLQLKTKPDVYLAANTAEEYCDFKIEGSWLERSCVIYAGNSNNIIAQMHKRHTAQSILLGKDTYGVTVYPNVDYAFIVAIIVILQEFNKSSEA